MKPNFALQFSHDGVAVLQRAATGWLSLGAVRFDDPDLDARMAALLHHARTLAPDGIHSKLVMPAEEVRYATVLAPGPTDEARRLQIEDEIERLTPYKLAELAFDWVIEGDLAMVAIAARETLADVEGFATQHGFNPVSFVAAPSPAEFSGEPFLGRTSVATTLLPPGEKVRGDVESVRVTGQVPPLAPVVAPPSAVATETASETGQPEPDQAEPPQMPVPDDSGATKGSAAQPASGKVPVRDADIPGSGRRPAVPQVTARNVEPGQPVMTPPLPASGATPPASAPRVPAMRPTAARTTSTAARATDAVQGSAPPATAAPDAEVSSPAPAPAALRITPPQPAAPEGAGGQFGGLVRRLGAQSQRGKPTETPPAGAAAVDGVTTAVLTATRPEETPPATVSLGERPDDDGDDPAVVAFATRRSARPKVVVRNEAPPPANPSNGGRIAVVPSRKSAVQRTIEQVRSGLGTLAGTGGTRISDAASRTRQRLGALRLGSGAAASRLRVGAQSAAIFGRVSQGATAMGTALRGNLGRIRLPGRAQVANPGGQGGATADVQSPITPAQTVARAKQSEAERQRAAEAEALTIFGARTGQGVGTPGMARRGLMAAAGFGLLVLAGGVWLAFFSNRPAPVELAQDAVPQAEISAPAELSAAAPPLPIAPSEQPPEQPAVSQTAEAPLSAQETTPDAAVPSTDPEVLLEQLVQEALDDSLPQMPAADLSETIADLAAVAPGSETATLQGVPQAAPVAESVADPQIAAMPDAPEPGPSQVQRLVVPAPLELPPLEEVALVLPAPPPPPGVDFDLGPDGLVVATAEGALSPTGILVYAGRPEAVPPTRPAATLQPELAAPAPVVQQPDTPTPDVATAPAEVVAPAGIVADDTPRADPALAGFRPQPRSPRVQALAPQTTAPVDAPAPPSPEPAPGDSGSLMPLSEPDTEFAQDLTPPPAPGGVSLAALRPQQRPTDLVAAPLEEDPTGIVAASLVPPTRPGDLTARVQAALAANQAPAAAAAAPAQTAPATATASRAPQIPTVASVAEQATLAGAINLRRVNLIGVFGTASERRALVRLSNGTILRVQVGDELDGGRVSAISDSELRYTRGGQDQILRVGSNS